MRAILIGADFEENLGMGMIAAAATGQGHAVAIVPFNTREDTPAVVQRILAAPPDVVGLAMQFQHRAHEFLGLAQRLRDAGAHFYDWEPPRDGRVLTRLATSFATPEDDVRKFLAITKG